MPVAAVPKYLRGEDQEFYLTAPPGHRFLLYFAVWGENQETGEIDWRVQDRVPRMKRRQGQLVQEGWDDVANDQYACTIAACKTPAYDEERPRLRRPRRDGGLAPWIPMMNGLLQRQATLAATLPADCLLRLEAKAVAPFTTGLGNEHPLENGFAFLNPYGLPYLAGSGVKGVLRQAARELASGEWGATQGWSTEKNIPLMQGEGERRKPVLDDRKQPVMLSVIDVLFGLESCEGDKEHVRGALTFWDVIPQIAGDSLMVEIMTPHQSHYYQQKQEPKTGGSVTPHDSGQPNPIVFLTVPPGSDFTFHVLCDRLYLMRLAPELLDSDPATGRPRWQQLMEAAFTHAFEWLGFGAKTAVGYGAMETEAMRSARLAREQEWLLAQQAAEAKRRQEEAVANAEAWPGARLKFNRTNGTLTAEKDGRSAHALAPKGKELLATLSPDTRRKVENNQFVRVTAYVSGSTLVRVEC